MEFITNDSAASDVFVANDYSETVQIEKREKVTRGRGAGLNVHNRFASQSYTAEVPEMLDEDLLVAEKTQIISTYPKTILNKVDSSDLPFEYSLNPYQGCEHGCVYCYARPTHEYWGYSGGLDFERKIIVKKNAVELLEKQLSSKQWKVAPIMLSGNTDCYQPIERDLEITRRLLQVCLKYKQPVSIITKNTLIKRDLDILRQLAAENLVHVYISITGIDEKLRRIMEPRTATFKARIELISTLTAAGVPVGVMVAPIIPGLNNHEIPLVLQEAGIAGARTAGMTIVRLNGVVEPVFKEWLERHYPDRAEKVWSQIAECHGGSVSDSRSGVRMRGEGKIAASIHSLFDISKQRFISEKPFAFNLEAFNRDANDIQLSLF
jgi:DNA repair photolyase